MYTELEDLITGKKKKEFYEKERATTARHEKLFKHLRWLLSECSEYIYCKTELFNLLGFDPDVDKLVDVVNIIKDLKLSLKPEVGSSLGFTTDEYERLLKENEGLKEQVSYYQHEKESLLKEGRAKIDLIKKLKDKINDLSNELGIYRLT
jgi:hypothetical protein